MTKNLSKSNRAMSANKVSNNNNNNRSNDNISRRFFGSSSSSSSSVVLPKVFPLIFHETFFPLDNKREMQSQRALLYALAFEYAEKNKLNTHTHTHARSIYTKRVLFRRETAQKERRSARV